MYSREIDRLEELQHTIRAILPLLNPYVEGWTWTKRRT
jgi:hypothetical protein